MHRFYVTKEQIHNEQITITGPDVNHIKNVLRMGPGDELIICNGQGKDCYCIITMVSDREIITEIKEIKETGTELPAKIILFQGIPKKDKMELIIQKAVELGVAEIVPVMTKRVIVKLEDRKKEARKLERWQAIAESAAKQSGRGIIPQIKSVQTFEEAINHVKKMDIGLIPYENAKDMEDTRSIIGSLTGKSSIGIFIGPEGGFDKAEIDMAEKNGVIPITLGKRILRTETAGLAILSMITLFLDS